MMYEALKERFAEVFGTAPALLFSAPGRAELCGNHTDHQCGMILAASINLETVAAVRPAAEPRIRLLSEGYPMCEVDLSQLAPEEEEKESTAALIRGVAAGFAGKGKLGGGPEKAVAVGKGLEAGIGPMAFERVGDFQPAAGRVALQVVFADGGIGLGRYPKRAAFRHVHHVFVVFSGLSFAVGGQLPGTRLREGAIGLYL